ncbi:MAG: UDP-N-acetylglucosamine 4,6-dehydratase (inverting) [Candidatus Binatia bacterium]
MDFLADRSILITGGTGSFGRRFVDHVLAHHRPRRLIVFSRDELKQSEMREALGEHPSLRFFLGDVRDRDRLRRAFHGVDVVIHAAALKQVPVAEYNPWECVQTNVLGAQNVIEAAIDRGVKRVVALSSDKAANPVNLYGATKLVSDKLFVAGNTFATHGESQFAVVRYGNVMGSRGSVVPLYRKLRPTGRIPVTDRRMTRFWITLDQAVGFVLRALRTMRGGEIFVPKLPSMRIVDLVTAVAPDCVVEDVGIRPGEKLHEVMITPEDARKAVEFDEHFVVYPAFPWWSADLGTETGGKPVADGFTYASNTNDRWLAIDELRRLLDEDGIRPAAPTNGATLMRLPYSRRRSPTRTSPPSPPPCATSGSPEDRASRFEAMLAERVGARHAIAVSSGTAALHVAYLAAGLGAGDTLLTSPLTFVATATTAVHCGARPRFADVDVRGALDAASVAASVAAHGTPRIVVPVHYAGHPAPIADIAAAAPGALVVEDACHALGAAWRHDSAWEPVGSCAHSAMAVFSFHAVKTITTAEGGAIVTNDAVLAARCRRLRDHGIVRDPAELPEADGPWWYELQEPGFNYRLNDVLAALGTAQLARIDRLWSRRRRIVATYETALDALPWVRPVRPAPGTRSSHHLYPVRVPAAVRRALFVGLRARGIGVQVHYIPVHLQPLFQRTFGTAPGDCPVAEAFYQEVLSLPCFPDMVPADVDRVVKAMADVARDTIGLMDAPHADPAR